MIGLSLGHLSHVQADVLCDEINRRCKFIDTAVFRDCFAFLKEHKKTLEDEKKHHGAVDESLSEQQFCKLDAITFVV